MADNHIMSLVKQVYPDFPDDRNVYGSRDVTAWYRIRYSDKTLIVPPINVLKVSIKEIDRFAESVRNFATADLESTEFRRVSNTTRGSG